MDAAASSSRIHQKWWAELDSNQRRRKPADLQSAPVGRLGICPSLKEGIGSKDTGIDYANGISCLFARPSRVWSVMTYRHAVLLLVMGAALPAPAEEKSPEAWMELGVTAFFEARIADSVAAFDEVVKAVPRAKPQLWQRGLALYYAERFQEGKEQFEVHQTANANDVENAVWHFLCVARLKGVEAAREQLIPIRGDSRVPMSEVHDLFAGKGSVEAVLEAASAGEESERRRNHLCYAHLYLGLYFEALGDKTKARKHILKAASNYAMDHYMGKTAVTHARVRGWMK